MGFPIAIAAKAGIYLLAEALKKRWIPAQGRDDEIGPGL
jgi:hypothetical protein